MASPEPLAPRHGLSVPLETPPVPIPGAAPPSICVTPCGSPPSADQESRRAADEEERPLALLYHRPQDRLLLGSCDSIDSEAMVSVGEVGDLGTMGWHCRHRRLFGGRVSARRCGPNMVDVGLI